MLWWAFALSAVLFTALAVLLAIAVDDADRTVVVLGAVVVDDSGWKVAEVLTPVTYVVWSLWLIAVGVGHSSEEVATTAAGHAPAGARY